MVRGFRAPRQGAGVVGGGGFQGAVGTLRYRRSPRWGEGCVGVGTWVPCALTERGICGGVVVRSALVHEVTMERVKHPESASHGQRRILIRRSFGDHHRSVRLGSAGRVWSLIRRWFRGLLRGGRIGGGRG